MSVSLTNVDSWSNETAGGIKYRLMEGFPKGSFNQGGGKVQEQYLIQSSDLMSFVTESFPLMELTEENWVFPFNRSLPGSPRFTSRQVGFEPFPPGRPANPWEGHGSSAGSMTDFLKVTIDYETTKRDKKDDENDPKNFLEISCDGSAEFLMLPMNQESEWVLGGGESMAAVTEKNKDPVNVPRLMPEISWNVRWPRVTRSWMVVLFGRCRNLMGMVNNQVMDLLFNPPVETILFTGFSMREEFGWREEEPPAVEFDMKFLEKNLLMGGVVAGHNHFYRPETGKWEKLKRPDGLFVYESGDLNSLWDQ